MTVSQNKIKIRGEHLQKSFSLFKKVNQFLKRHAFHLGFIPIQSEKSIQGSGNHYGSSFPMKKYPKKLHESDLFGRPFNLKRTHLVDASVFPSIPAQSITLTVMANAYRIANTFSGD